MRSRPGILRTMRKPFKSLASYGVIAVLGLVLSELVLSLLLDHSAIVRYLPREALRRYYKHSDRQIIQYMPECAVYDRELTYRLRPGSCRFRNREFDVVVEVNSLGVRDDEASLSRPEIIVAGDSHAMGWGVEREATFAELLEAETGSKVLNAAVSSYGTVRELKILEGVDTAALRYLVIQYCANDYRENRTYRDHGNVLPVTDEAEFERLSRRRRGRVPYYFGKHLRGLLPRKSRVPEADRPDEAEVFLNALKHAPIDLDGVRLLVFELVGHGRNDDEFITALASYPAAGAHAEILSDLVVLDMSSVLGPRDFFVLDDHMTERGHRAVADRLLAVLRREAGL